ncbi:hypothetical protein [Pseudoalteromonas sp. PS5]|uniref:hypothetical protein n=1 Tax=Pseudoalteromonas sp. PS5 TaxID=1437473 RepID=UPI000FFED718|nr:hypothetical protein [Pseudoalteromonas sp. PS5]RXF07188.1 hypothetical protein D9603_00425 [Pseudoalteromonas sp. PS5]
MTTNPSLKSSQRHEHDFPVVDDENAIAHFHHLRAQFIAYLKKSLATCNSANQKYIELDLPTLMILENRFSTHNDFCSVRLKGYSSFTEREQIHVAINCANALAIHSHELKDLNSLNSTIKMLDWLEPKITTSPTTMLDKEQTKILLNTLELEHKLLLEHGFAI